jgi:hypothetical protein
VDVVDLGKRPDRSSIGFKSDCNNTTATTTGNAVSSGQLFDGINTINPPASLDPQARSALLNSGI